MDNFKILKNYVEGTIRLEALQNEIAKNAELESILVGLQPIPPYSNGQQNLFHYLLALTPRNVADHVDAQDALQKALEQLGVTYTASNNSNAELALLLSVQPKWANVSDKIFLDLLNSCGELKGKDLKMSLRTELKKIYTYMKKPPDWLQSPDWPMANGQPMVFVGQLSAGEEMHDQTEIYVFVSRETNTVTTVVQSY